MLGIFIGSGYSVMNFVLIAISVERLISLNLKQVRFRAVAHYLLRYLLLGMVVVIVLQIVDSVDLISFIVSLFFSKVAIFVQILLIDK